MEEKVEYANQRLIRALKLIVYFSVVLPPAFMRYYQEDEIHHDIVYCNENKFDSTNKRNSKKGQAFLQKFMNDPEW